MNFSFGQTTLTSRATGNWNANDTWISGNLTGTITTSTTSATVTGTGTNFTGQLSVGATLYKTDGTALIGTISSINSATSITLTVNALNNNSGINFKVRKIPGALDTAIILKDNVVVTIPSGIIATCATLELGSNGSSSSENLTFASTTSSLSVSGNATVFGPTSANVREIKLNTGTMNISGNLALGTGQTGNQDNRVSQLTITSGTITVSGNLTFNNIAGSNPLQTQINMSGGGGTFNLGGTFTINNNSGTLLPGTSSTFNFNGSVAQTIPIGVSNVDYNTINSNNTNSGGATLSATILTNNVSGSIAVGTINSGSLLNTANNAITLNNSDGITIANNSTINAGTSVVTFGTSGFATINGTFQTANVNGFSGATSTALNSNNNPTITLGSNSTIEYNSSGNQTVTTRSDYANLTLSNSGTKSLLTALNISGKIDISGSAKALLPNNSYSSASTITFDKILQTAIGSWGSTASIASNKTDVRFLTGYSGLLGKPCSVTTANANTDQTNCNNSNFTLAGNTVATSGETGTWSFFNGTGTITNSNSPTTTVVITGTTATLRWTIVKTEGCYSYDDVVLTNNASSTIANANNDQIKCNTSTFTLAGNSATIGTGNWTVILGTATITTPSSNISGITAVSSGTSATLRWTISNGTCVSTDDVVLTNSSTSVAGTVSGGTAICNGSTSPLLTLTGYSGTITKWQSAISPFTSWTDIVNSAATYTSGALSATTQYRAVVQTGSCTAVNSVTTNVSVNPTSVGGTVTGGTTICSGNSSALLTLSGYSGNITKWQSAISPFTTWTDITNTATTYTSGALAATTQFRAVVQSGSCALANSAVTTVTVIPLSNGGTVTGGTTICLGNTSALLTLSGYTGSITKWQSAISPFITWTDIVNTTTTYTSGALTATTQFRAVVQSGSCTSANSSVTTVTVDPLSNGGTVTGGTTICSGNTSALLTLSSYTGSITKWQSAISPFTTWTDIVNTATTFTSGALTATTQFRAVVQSGSCTSANSVVTTVTVDPLSNGGTVTGGTTICSGNTSALLTLSGHTGSITKWQSAISPFTTWTDIVNTATTYTSGALTATTQFRAVVQSGSCTSANSAVTTVTVDPLSNGGTVTGGTTICSGNTSALLTLSGYTGSITKWQSAISPFTTWTDIVNTATTYTSGALTATTQFRAVVQSGSCTSANSSVTTVTVDPLSNGGTVTGGTTICSGNTSALLTLSGHTGSITKWQSAISPFTTWTDIVNTATTYTSGALTATTQFRAVVQSGSCASANSAVTTVTTNSTSIAGSITGSATVCPGTNSTLLTLTGNTGTIQWQTASDNSSFSNINLAAGSTYTASNLTATTYYRAMVTSGVCPSINSESAIISIKTTTFNGVSWDNGNPSATTSIVYNFIGNYTLPNTIAACSCTVSSGNVTVPTGKSMILLDKLTVTNGSLTIENNANLIQTNSVSNSGNITVKRNSGLQVRLDHTLWSSPVSNVNLYGFSPLTLTNRFYTYATATNTYVTIGLSAASTFTIGKGFAVRAPNTFPSTPQTWEGNFTGVPNNGTVPFALETTGTGYNLVGNPYPSAIDAASFVGGNPAINGNLYFYAHTLTMGTNGLFPSGTNYAIWNSLGSTAATPGTSGVPALVPNGIIQAGQGFIVKATNPGSVNFTNSMRVGNTENQFFRHSTTIERHRLWLNLANENGIEINQILVGYIEGATSGYDSNYDGLSFGNSGSYLSSKIDGLDYTIQGRALPFSDNDIVSLGFKATLAGNYSISLSAMDGLFLGNQPVYILDTATNTVHDIKTSAFTFYSEMGVFDNRFQLVYNQALGNNIPTFNSNSVITYKKDGVIYVASIGIQLKEIEVYDVTGRLVYRESNINSTLGILSQLKTSNEVLLLKIISNDNQTITRKLIN